MTLLTSANIILHEVLDILDQIRLWQQHDLVSLRKCALSELNILFVRQGMIYLTSDNTATLSVENDIKSVALKPLCNTLNTQCNLRRQQTDALGIY